MLLFETEGGIFGFRAQKGGKDDSLCVLFGSKVPFVMHKDL